MARGEGGGRHRGEGRSRGSLGERHSGAGESLRRGDHRTATGRDPYSEKFERERRGGGRYDAGPGHEGLPGAKDMDRPDPACGAFERTGSSRGNMDRAQREIQDAEPRYREHK
ncbi:MAG TPA: hypothetical protein VGI28_01775 [Stellaceae bacterium]|jgi:hypothetical protein